ncbi:MAG TPA: endolytic transglycosylase MltG [Actinomycetota bacterium]|nr:endolytic transglycosylase MltG [Actinomycetota bacterium]
MIRKTLLIAVVLSLAIGGAAAYALVRTPEPGERVQVEVQAGQSTTAVAAMLERREIVPSALAFRLVAKARRLDGRIEAGSYELRRNMGVQAALDALSRGAVTKSVTITIPEGYTVKQVARKVGSRGPVSQQDFMQVAESGRVRPKILPDRVRSLEGFIFPETYVIEEKDTAEQLLTRMVQEFESKTSALDWSEAESKGLTRHQALVLASLVEREAKVAEDRAKVAAVIYNRLAKGMALQIDATLLYELPAHKVPTRKDRKRDSPYNTYTRKGLPPTPIANPGLEAIRAALQPAPIDALYYVVIDKSGRHGFTKDYNEFLRLTKLTPRESRGG